MRKFSFPLERVLKWRQLEARIEENKLETVRGQLRQINEQRADLDRSLAEAESTTSEAQRRPSLYPEGFSALELAAVGAFRRHVAAGQARLAAARSECLLRLHAQSAALVRKHRNVKLIEKLKEHKVASWAAELDREIVQQAEETYSARRRPKHHPAS